MPGIKLTKKYYFSVDGETEKWYLDWLQTQINNEAESKYKVSIDSKIQNPLKRAKSLNVTSKVEVTHLCDYESNEEKHVTQFRTSLDWMKEVSKLGKTIKYNLGYSNFTFELWMILHKANCNASLTHRGQYLGLINKAYGESFQSLDQFKQEDNFKKGILTKISLQDVKDAIGRSKAIMQRNEDNDYVLQQYKNFCYYKENPSLSIWESIKRIIEDCEL